MIYDLSMLKKLSDNNEVFIIDMLQTFKRTTPPIIKSMEEHVEQQKYEQLGREAHKLIPGVSFLGAKELEKVLVTIEENSKAGINTGNMPALVSEAKKIVDELIACFEKEYKLE
jgi:HPt (histidine-containing phosphotransfer) domain-containing protein